MNKEEIKQGLIVYDRFIYTLEMITKVNKRYVHFLNSGFKGFCTHQEYLDYFRDVNSYIYTDIFCEE
jgi:hypothetical protein